MGTISENVYPTIAAIGAFNANHDLFTTGNLEHHDIELMYGNS